MILFYVFWGFGGFLLLVLIVRLNSVFQLLEFHIWVFFFIIFAICHVCLLVWIGIFWGSSRRWKRVMGRFSRSMRWEIIPFFFFLFGSWFCILPCDVFCRKSCLSFVCVCVWIMILYSSLRCVFSSQWRVFRPIMLYPTKKKNNFGPFVDLLSLNSWPVIVGFRFFVIFWPFI